MSRVFRLIVDALIELAKTPQTFLPLNHTFSFTYLSMIFNSFLGKADKNQQKLKYWCGKSIDEIIVEADKLYEESKYLEVYEILNRLKFANNLDVQWRIGRTLFKLSCQNTIAENIRKEMIQEAYDIMTATLARGDSISQLHKWMAIILDRKNAMEGIEVRMRNSEVVKQHLMRCCQLNPSDVSAQYLLGRWCYEMSNITWFQRMLGKFIYGNIPTSTNQEAHKYLLNAEDLHPKFYLQNTYLLGKTCMKLGQYYRAKYYFNVVVSLPANTDQEKRSIADAKRMLRRLEKYNLDKNVLFYEYPFGTDE